MSDKKPKGPVFLGTKPTDADPNLEQARKAVEARNAERLEKKPAGPDILAAQGMYDAKRDGPMTISQLGQSQKAFEGVPPEQQPRPTTVSDETAKGLQLFRSEADKERQRLEEMAAQTATPTPPAAPAPQAAPASAPKPEPRSSAEGPDDLEFDRLMAFGAQRPQDPINNDAERKAVEERVKKHPIDLLAAILDGEITQLVPIVPGVLEVVYRVVTPEEDHAIRLHIFEVTSKQGRLEALASELYQLLVLTASVERINGTQLPSHLTRNPTSYELIVNMESLISKSRYFLSRPMPLVNAMSVHGFWFEQRVRKAFSTASQEDLLGNG